MKISVVLTSYNHEEYLAESIQSVLDQTYQNFEFIIVDDCSTDSSWDIICEYKKKHEDIIAIRHDYNWNGGTIADIVANHATGDYIALHHSDDVWDVNKLQMQVDAMKSVPGCVAVFTNAQAINDEGRPYTDEGGFYYNLFQVENRSRQEWLNYFFYKGNCLCHPSILIRRDVYMEDGFFRKGLRQIPDFVKWIQICSKYEIHVLPEPLVKFRVHQAGKNSSGMRADTQIRSTIELYLMLNEYKHLRTYDEFIAVFPDAQEFCKKDYFIPEYALGKVCTQEFHQPYTKLFGISLLYEALNNPEHAQILKTEYNYTMQDFMVENGKTDIFKILPPGFEQVRSIYIDTGKGFNSEQVKTQKFACSDMLEYEWTCSIDLTDDETLSGLRFDPVEGVMIKSEILSVTVNGVKAKMLAEGALESTEGVDVFLNLDPIYHLDIPRSEQEKKHVELTIIARLERLSENDKATIVQAYAGKKNEEIRSLKEENETLTNRWWNKILKRRM